MEAIETDGVLGCDIFDTDGTGVIFERGGYGVHKELNARFKFGAGEFFAGGVFGFQGAEGFRKCEIDVGVIEFKLAEGIEYRVIERVFRIGGAMNNIEGGARK